MRQRNEQKMQGDLQHPSNTSHGGHELFDVHEAIGDLIGGMEQHLLYEQYVQDQELKNILNSHRHFMEQMYHTIIDTVKTGRDPDLPTQTYQMEQNNEVVYGLQPSAPKSPAQTTNEINDECISSFMLGLLKQISSSFTTTALEATNAVLRRVLADSIPNVIEMAYEIFLYQNKKQYYQVPQLQEQDMYILRNSFSPIQDPIQH